MKDMDKEAFGFSNDRAEGAKVQVTVFDPKTGETETAELDPNSYILLTGEHMEVSSLQRWPMSGTVRMTLKRVPR